MLKNILKLEGAQILSKQEQNAIHGGNAGLCYNFCYQSSPCPEGSFCLVAQCYPGPNGPLFGRCVGNNN